jgi:hypothetical protein
MLGDKPQVIAEAVNHPPTLSPTTLCRTRALPFRAGFATMRKKVNDGERNRVKRYIVALHELP